MPRLSGSLRAGASPCAGEVGLAGTGGTRADASTGPARRFKFGRPYFADIRSISVRVGFAGAQANRGNPRKG